MAMVATSRPLATLEAERLLQRARASRRGAKAFTTLSKRWLCNSRKAAKYGPNTKTASTA